MTVSKDLTLTDITQEDMPYIYGWFSDENFLKFYDYMPPVPQSPQEVDKTIGDYVTEDTSEVFAIRKISDGRIIGLSGLDDIVKPNGVATLFIGIGDNSQRGRGYGRQALDILLEYGFDTMKLYRIQLQVLQFNTAAISLYEKAGFVREGTFRQFVLRDSLRYDLLLYGLLENEWRDMRQI